MFRVEVLFKNAQVILLNFDTSQQAYDFLGQVAKPVNQMVALSSQTEEAVLNVSEIVYARLNKDSEFRTQKKQEDRIQEHQTRQEFEKIAIDDEIQLMKEQLK